MTAKANDKTTDETLDERGMKLAAETLTGDIRDAILNAIKGYKGKPWDKQSEAEQRDTIYGITNLAERIVRTAAQIIAAGGRRHVQASVKKVTISDGYKLDLEVSKFDPERHALADASMVLIVLPEVDAFFGQRATQEAAKDQPALFDKETGEIKEQPSPPPQPNGAEQQPSA